MTGCPSTRFGSACPAKAGRMTAPVVERWRVSIIQENLDYDFTTRRDVLAHQAAVPWPSQRQVEQDLLLCQTMVALFEIHFAGPDCDAWRHVTAQGSPRAGIALQRGH